jgi:hypothetical protein
MSAPPRVLVTLPLRSSIVWIASRPALVRHARPRVWCARYSFRFDGRCGQTASCACEQAVLSRLIRTASRPRGRMAREVACLPGAKIPCSRGEVLMTPAGSSRLPRPSTREPENRGRIQPVRSFRSRDAHDELPDRWRTPRTLPFASASRGSPGGDKPKPRASRSSHVRRHRLDRSPPRRAAPLPERVLFSSESPSALLRPPPAGSNEPDPPVGGRGTMRRSAVSRPDPSRAFAEGRPPLDVSSAVLEGCARCPTQVETPSPGRGARFSGIHFTVRTAGLVSETPEAGPRVLVLICMSSKEQTDGAGLSAKILGNRRRARSGRGGVGVGRPGHRASEGTPGKRAGRVASARFLGNPHGLEPGVRRRRFRAAGACFDRRHAMETCGAGASAKILEVRASAGPASAKLPFTRAGEAGAVPRLAAALVTRPVGRQVRPV